MNAEALRTRRAGHRDRIAGNTPRDLSIMRTHPLDVKVRHISAGLQIPLAPLRLLTILATRVKVRGGKNVPSNAEMTNLRETYRGSHALASPFDRRPDWLLPIGR